MNALHYGNITDKGRTSSTISPIRTCHSAIALLLFSPAFIFLSCETPDESHTGSPEEDGSGTLFIRPVAESRSAGSTDVPEFVDVFIFNDDELKRIDSYQRLQTDGDGMIAAASRKGRKIVVAISNPQANEYDWNSISSFETIAEMYSDLRLENPDKPLMSGVAYIEAEENGCFEISMTPLVSEIYVRSIRCDFSGKPYSQAILENASIYLANINSLARIIPDGDFIPTAPINTDGLPYESCRILANPGMVHASIGQDIGSSTVYPGIRLYCYPNSSENDTAGTPFTRLVIAGDIGGNRYYYPININKGEFGQISAPGGIGRNCRYVFDIIIRKTGSADPTIPVSPETAEIFTGIVPWTEIETDIGF